MGNKRLFRRADAKDDGIDIDALAAEIEGAGASKEPKGKKKKKGAKKDEFEYDMLLLFFYYNICPSRASVLILSVCLQAPPAAPPSDSDDDSGSRSRLKTKEGKKMSKKASVSDDDEDEGVRGGGGGGGGKEDDDDDNESDDDEVSSRRDKKKKNKGKAAKADSEEEQDDEEGGGFKMKTAAQKKAEKKERDKKKKEEERLKQKKLKEKEASGDAKVEPEKTTEATPPPTAPPAAVAEEQEGAEPAAEGETSNSIFLHNFHRLFFLSSCRRGRGRQEEERQEEEEGRQEGGGEGEEEGTHGRLELGPRPRSRCCRLKVRGRPIFYVFSSSGVEVPSKDSMPKKKPIYTRKKKPTTQTPEGTTLPPPLLLLLLLLLVDHPIKNTSSLKHSALSPSEPAGSEEDEDEEDKDDDEEDEDDDDDEEESDEEAEKVEATSAGQTKRKAAKESEDESSESEDDDRTKEERLYDRAKRRIEKRRAENLKNVDVDRLRSPVVCVLGHVDTGKTKILDKLRHTHVQDGEAGGITQQIGATNVPKETIEEQTRMVKNFEKDNLRIPGMLIIDTPGHESFSNLRNRGSSLCDIAILVVDIMHGIEPQTLESINLLKEKKCPFIVALNKVDRLYDWKKSPETDIVTTLKKQKKNTKDEFDERAKAVIVEFAQQGLNAALFYENKDPRTFVSLVPTSAHSGDGMGNLIALLVELTQTMLARRLAHCDELRAQVMEVKALPGMGTTIDVILINGRLREGETIIVPGVEGPIVTQIRGLLLPPPLKELRVKSQYEKHKEVSTAQGVKILGKDLEKALAGLPLLVAEKEDEVPVLRDELVRELKQTLSSIKLEEKGVYVQASTLGSLEALLEFLRTSKVPYAGINIGPVHKRDVMKASAMLEHDVQYAVILAFDVKVERESQEMADSLGVRIFSAEIIYHLFDAFTKYREDYKKAKQDEFKHVAVFPAKLRVLPQFIFNSRDPIVMGVTIEAGVLRQGTPLCVPSKGFVDIGVVTSIEMNHKSVESAKKGQEICIKIEPIPGESPKMYGRHFEATDIIVSKITRASIDALKNWFRDEMQKTDWQLIMELKKTFEII
uniref:Eukaryotic translation initiation factor 5B n=1 Tax=Sparus aurata TaxID=8175 RepID=A0A671U8Y3_SPAAU